MQLEGIVEFQNAQLKYGQTWRDALQVQPQNTFPEFIHYPIYSK